MLRQLLAGDPRRIEDLTLLRRTRPYSPVISNANGTASQAIEGQLLNWLCWIKRRRFTFGVVLKTNPRYWCSVVKL